MAADTTLDHSTPVAGTGGIGAAQEAAIGETFTAVPDQYLKDFGFSLENYYGPLTFNLTIASWDGTTTGPALFQSTPLTADDETGTGQPRFYSFATDGLRLTPGQQYAAYISQVIDPTTTNDTAILEMNISYLSDTRDSPPFVVGIPYPDGTLIYYANNGWNSFSSPGYDVVGAFRADFTTNAPVPEASTMVSFGLLLALGMGGVVLAKKKKASA